MPTPEQISHFAAQAGAYSTAAFGAFVGAMSLADRAIVVYKNYTATTPGTEDDEKAARWAGRLELVHGLVSIFSVKGRK